MKLVFTRAANSDIADIENYIARDNVAASRRFVLKLLEACEALVEQPRAYRASGILNLRQRLIGEYLIFYRVTDAI